jgi:hypothetical protein
LGLQDSDDEAEAADQASDQVRFILFYWNEFTFNFAVSAWTKPMYTTRQKNAEPAA